MTTTPTITLATAITIALCCNSLFPHLVDAFPLIPTSLPPPITTRVVSPTRHLSVGSTIVGSRRNRSTSTTTFMAGGGGGGANKKKRRRRKAPEPQPSTPPSPKTPPSTSASTPTATSTSTSSTSTSTSTSGASSRPKLPPLVPDPTSIRADGPIPSDGPAMAVVEKAKDYEVAPLPDIRNVLRKKEEKKEQKEKEELRKSVRPKIKRDDKEAFLQLLEAEPFADADDSFFVEEEYGIVSAFLGEGALDFLGIPPGPLQIGHFIGALGIVLCAFVEYPGFPLTNLPTPLRSSLQGGLATIYTINFFLAILAFFKAGERGQPGILWAAKTFSVGGLAFDQLTQLPTLEEVKRTGIKR